MLGDPKWLRLYVAGLLLAVGLTAGVVVLTTGSEPTASGILVLFVLVCPLVPLVFWVSVAPSSFFVRASISLLEDPGSGTKVWKLNAMPVNVKTLRQLGAPRSLPGFALYSPIFAIFGPDSLSFWYRRGLSLSLIGSVSRSEVHLIATLYSSPPRSILEIRRGTTPIGELAILPSRGSVRWALTGLPGVVTYVASWVRG
jgi:Zn-dependent protease with chaperone function